MLICSRGLCTYRMHVYTDALQPAAGAARTYGTLHAVILQLRICYPDAVLKVEPRLCMLSNACSHDCSNASDVGRAVGSRARHLSTVRRSPRSFSCRPFAASLAPSHGSSVRPKSAALTAASDPEELTAAGGKTRSPVSSSKAMTPMAQMSTAALTWMVLLPASRARTTSGAAYFREKIRRAVVPAATTFCHNITQLDYLVRRRDA